MFSISQKKILTTKSDFKTSALSFQIESKCFQYLKKRSLRQNPSSKHPLYHFKSSPNVFNTSKKDPYDKIRLQNIRFIISNRVQDFSIPQKKPLTTKSVFKTSALSFQIESKCFQYLKKSPLRQNPSSKHPLDHFKSSPNVFNTSKQDPYDKIRLQNIRFIISNRVQMFSIPQKKILTTKSDFKTSALSFQIESKCFQYLKKRSLRQNPSSKHPLYHFKSSPNVFNTSKKDPYYYIPLQNIRFIISNRVQIFSIPQKKILTTKSVFKTSALSFQIESKYFQYLKKRSLRQNPSSKHPLDHFKSSPNIFNTSKKDPYDKIRLQNIRLIISNRVQMFSIPQNKTLTTKSVFKTSALSFQIESKCFQHLKKRSLRQNPSSKHPLYHFKSSPNVFNTSKKDPYDKIRLQNIRFIISNRVQMFSIPQKKILTTKSDFKTSALSFQIESKCFQYLKKRSLRQNPTSKHPLDHFKSSPNDFNILKKDPYDKIRLQNIRFIISNRVQMFSIPQKKILTTKSVFKTSALSFQIESKCFQHLKKRSLRQNPTSKHPLYHFKSSPNVFNTSKKDPYDKIRLQNIRFIISNRVQMFSIPQKKILTTKSVFKTSALSFQIESKCFQYLKKRSLRQNPTSKHPFDHFKSSPNVFNISKKDPYDNIRLQNIRFIISNRVQMCSIPQKKILTTKSVFKTSALSFQIESKCFQYLKKRSLRQNPTSKHPLYHFKSSPNVFNTSKKDPYDKIRLQNIRFIISNRVQMFSIPQKKILTTKSVFKTSALSFQIESKCFQYLKKRSLRQNPTSKHPPYHFKSSPNVFNTSKKDPYDKIRLQNIRLIISNRVQMFSTPQKKILTTKSDFKTSALSFQIESKCFQYLKKRSLRQNPTSKHPLYHFKSSQNVFNTSKKDPYDKIRLQIIRFIISNRVQMFSMPQKKPLATKPDFKTSALSFQIESKCFLFLKKSPLPQTPTSKHPLYHFKSSPNVFYASKKAPHHKIRLQNIRLIISNRVQMFSMPQKKPLTTKFIFKTSALSFQIESKCFLCLKKSPLRQNLSSKHPPYHFKSSPNVFYASKKASSVKIRLQNIRLIISNRVQMFFMPQKSLFRQNPTSKHPPYHFKSSPNVFNTSKKDPYDKIRLQNIRLIISNRVQMFSTPQKKILTTKSDFKTSALSFQIESKCFQHLKKRSLRQNPSSKHPLYHFKSSPDVFNTSKKDPYDKIRLQNIRFIISNRVQMFSIPQKKRPLRQNPSSKHPLYHL